MNEVRAVIGVDPGVTTGLALVAFVDGKIEELILSEIDWRPLGLNVGSDGGRWAETFAAQRINEWMKNVYPADGGRGVHQVVIEDFVLRSTARQMDRSLLSPVRVTAMLMMELLNDFECGDSLFEHLPELCVCWRELREGVERCSVSEWVTFQQPSEGKVFATDLRLREWGLYGKTRGRKHARDALRYALVYARRREWWFGG